MSNIMSILKASFVLLGNISSAYSGTFKNSSSEIQQLRKEMRNLDYPSPKLDKQNLKNDCNNVAKDYKKAFDKYKK
ncbi:Uncharacterised protein [Bergeyella zoohelcum]|uniref:Uncharacterized protein n=2 Tax=Bergeyella zoohelcum TaxID=1015 RepID=A0A7Z8YS04_9FLAO|nr:Uncharacterised protein [Bergeyella zoohelcum]